MSNDLAYAMTWQCMFVLSLCLYYDSYALTLLVLYMCTPPNQLCIDIMMQSLFPLPKTSLSDAQTAVDPVDIHG
jgi:hypothetical protein